MTHKNHPDNESAGNKRNNQSNVEDDGFRDLIVSTTAYTFEVVQQAGDNISPELRSQTIHILEYALNLESAWKIAEDLLLTVAPHMERLGERIEWMDLLQFAIERCASHKYSALQAELQLQLGILYYLVNDYEQAKRMFLASIENFKIVTNCLGIARALNELGWVGQLQQDHYSANQYVEMALRLLDDTDPERGMSYRVLGMLANNEQRWSEALAYHHKSHELFKKANDPRRIAWSQQNMALALRNLERYEEAIDFYNEAASRLQALGDLHRWVMTQIGLGTAYLHSGNTVQAVSCFVGAEPVASYFQDDLFLAMIHNNLGLCQMNEKKFPQAAQHFQNAIGHYQRIGNTAWAINAMDGMAMASLEMCDFAKAKEIALEGISALPLIVGQPNYDYLYQSLHKHLELANGKR